MDTGRRTAAQWSPQFRSPQFRSALRHPLTITIVGFVLTSVIGVYLASHLDSLSKAHEAEHGRHARAVEAVIELSDLINERRTRAVLVATAIKRRSALKEVEARKSVYDEIYVRWNTKLEGLFLRILDEASNQTATADYGRYIEKLTHQESLGDAPAAVWRVGYLTLMDSCLTSAFDSYGKLFDSYEQVQPGDHKIAIQVLDACHFDDMNVRLIACSTAMVQSLYKAVTKNDPKSVPYDGPLNGIDIKSACSPLFPPT